ncbi:MAG: YlmC/YmxH family sporulation protein [Clostridia bacterium]|nr:YlmC/YmxH family sporulation protein [Clostridia bacterium]
MQLSFRELRKKDVINVADGRCLGRIIDLTLKFPQGILTGITVPGRKIYGFRLFDRTEVFIEESKILKIGGDVILVNLKGDNSVYPPKPPKPGCPPPKKTTCEDFLCGDCRIDQSDY